MHNGKIFGIGVSKAGTLSLHRAVQLLGYSSIHYCTPRLSAEAINTGIYTAINDGLGPLDYLPDVAAVDSLLDIGAVQRRFEEFDVAYPGSKFILHTRSLDTWLESNVRHAARNRRNRSYSGSWTDVDLESWTKFYIEQHERVRQYFVDRPQDLLEIDLTRGQGWDSLAPFLDQAIPESPFPHANAAGRFGRSSRLRRAVRDGKLASGLWRRLSP